MLPKSPAAQAQWPPRSPHEALLSTPGGRARLRRVEAARTSPSPLRTRQPGSRGFDIADGGEEGEELDGDAGEEDEETLQLQLQEIQAKLRLKKLQAAKAQKMAAADAASSARSTPGSRSRIGAATTATGNRDRLQQQPRSPTRNPVEVPASPIRRAQSAAETTQKSPKRVLLGIDKGLRGQDVSLKRPPSAFQRALAGSASSSSASGGASQRPPQQNQPPQPLSFNERLAAARSQEAAREKKSERIQKLRTSAFAVGREEMDQYKSKAVDIPVEPERPQQFSRDDILGAASGRKSAAAAEGGGSTLLRRSNTAPSIREKYVSSGNAAAVATPNSDGTSASQAGGSSGKPPSADEEASFEPYSGYHLAKRVLPHSVVARAVAGKTTYSLKDLLRTVKAPDFQLPDVETDVVVFAIVAAKSDPRAHKPVEHIPGQAAVQSSQKQQQDRGKYMVLTLVDLTYQVDLFLFKSGFDRFWKLSTGTVVAVLNPGVMPPPPGRTDTGRWSLVINSDADTVLEVGTARDLGYCKSVKRDGQLCSAWVNAKRTQYCEFHSSEGLRKMRATRNELNGAAGFGGVLGPSEPGKGPNSLRGGAGRWETRAQLEKRARSRMAGYDAEAGSHYFVAASKSDAVDGDVLGGGYADRVERQEGAKRRLAARERESEIARKLGELGSGAGRDYMQLAASRPTSVAADTVAGHKKKSSATGSIISAASLSSAATTRSSQSQSQFSTASSATTVGSSAIADPAAASRASLLASIAARRGGGNNATDRADSAGASSSNSNPVIHLGPAKRKRPQSALSSSTTGTGGGGGGSINSSGAGSSGAGLGWGSDLRAKLGRMKDGEKLAADGSLESGFRKAAAAAAASSSATAGAPHLPPPERSPVRKKTRFLLGGKGIREAGRESLGQTQIAAADAADEDEDEDELVII